MKQILYLGMAALMACTCAPRQETITGRSEPDLGWLFLEKGPYTLSTHVDAAPGEASIVLVTDVSLMADKPDTVLSTTVTVKADSTIEAALGTLEPGFYQLRLRDSVRWNIGIRPEAVMSAPDAPKDFKAFWQEALKELDQVPLEPEYTKVEDFSNHLRTCYEVRYASLDGAVSGGVISIPNAPGKYPVCIQYMGYGADSYYFDPSANPERIDFLVSVRDQGIFKEGQDRWIDRGIDSKEHYYYRGAFCDVKRAVDFAAGLEKANPERIMAWGESQGGAFTFVSAALDPRIRAIAVSVPFLGDYPDYARIVYWPVHEVMDQADKDGISHQDLFAMLRYFDVKNFAPQVKCPVYMAIGLQDPTCPPHTNFAIYNNLGTRDKQYLCVPTCGHAMWLEDVWAVEREAYMKKWLK